MSNAQGVVDLAGVFWAAVLTSVSIISWSLCLLIGSPGGSMRRIHTLRNGTDKQIAMVYSASPMPAETGEPRFVITGNGDGGTGADPGHVSMPAQPLTMSSVWIPT